MDLRITIRADQSLGQLGDIIADVRRLALLAAPEHQPAAAAEARAKRLEEAMLGLVNVLREALADSAECPGCVMTWKNIGDAKLGLFHEAGCRVAAALETARKAMEE